MVNVAIDGPAGAGKSTVARAAAKKLGYIYVDTGALYRAIGVNALRLGIDPKDAESVIPTLEKISVTLGFIDGVQHVFLNGEDVSEEIRLPRSSMAASAVSAIPEVREFLLSLQRDIAEKNNCFMDGRDIGTVILPNAQFKFFFTASAEIRAERRCKELCEKGIAADYDTVLAEIKERDYNDSHRAAAPLKKADDAVTVDSSSMTIEEAVNTIVGYVRGEKNG